MPEQRSYYDDAMCNYADVYDLEKQVMVVSSGKSTLAYETCVMLAERSNLQVHLAMLRCEDGERHEHAFISGRKPGSNSDVAKVMLDLVYERRESDEMSRPYFQYLMGRMFGYPMPEIVEFIASDTSRACPCDCCGGAYGLDAEYRK